MYIYRVIYRGFIASQFQWVVIKVVPSYRVLKVVPDIGGMKGRPKLWGCDNVPT